MPKCSHSQHGFTDTDMTKGERVKRPNNLVDIINVNIVNVPVGSSLIKDLVQFRFKSVSVLFVITRET